MIKITHLVVIAALALSCSTTFGQNFTFISPSSLTPSQAQGAGPVGLNFDISSDLGLAPGSVNLGVQNGFVNGNNDAWTVSDSAETIFTLSGPVDVLAQVSHGRNLGSDVATNGSQPRDGIRTGLTESWQLVSSLDTDYQFGTTPNASGLPGTGNLFVDYIGTGSTALESNSSNFLFQSNDAASTFTVFSNNTQQLNNNFSVGFAVAPVPEPASGLLLTLGAGTFFLRRKRS